MTSTAPATESVVPTEASTTTERSEKMLEGNNNKPSAWTGGANAMILQQSQEGKDNVEKAGEVVETNAPEGETKMPIEDTAPTATTASSQSAENEEIIDSALLSALRDPRERLPLLKLEQVLIDFLEKQPQDRYIDVGGPYNCIVVSPSQGHIGVSLEDAKNFGNNASGGNANGGYVRPQSTFQRLILHRLSDRFCMTREKSYVDEGFGYYIRVVKGPHSVKPRRLLLDVQPSEYAPQMMHESASTGSLAGTFEQMNVSGGAGDNPGASLPPSGTPPATVAKAPKPRKMKIMKRSDSGNASKNSGGDNKKTSKKETAKRNSSLSEKERKYAEARNRIFETQETAEEHFAPIPTTSANDTPTNKISPVTSGASSNAHSNASSRSSTPSHGNSTRTPPRTGSGGISSQPDGGTSSSNHKATYRNRQQEVADPDFRRGTRMQTRMVVPQQPVPGWNGGGATATPYYPNPNNAGRGYYGQQPHQKPLPQHQQYQYGVHPQHQQQQHQYYQQYYAAQQAAAIHHPANVAVYPGMQAGGMQQPPHVASYGQGVPMATGTATVVGKPSNDSANKTPVDMRREQFPALR